jgi:hypothetical protein
VVANLVSKTRPPKLPETREYLGKIGIFLLLNSNFPYTKSDFLQRLSDSGEIQENLLKRLSNFFNGFPLSSTAEIQENLLQRLSDFQEIRENLLQRLSEFFNGFPLSEKYKKNYLRRQVYKRSLFELRISHHLLPELCNSRYLICNSHLLIAIHHTALQVFKTCMLKWDFH